MWHRVLRARPSESVNICIKIWAKGKTDLRRTTVALHHYEYDDMTVASSMLARSRSTLCVCSTVAVDSKRTLLPYGPKSTTEHQLVICLVCFTRPTNDQSVSLSRVVSPILDPAGQLLILGNHCQELWRSSFAARSCRTTEHWA